MTITIDQLDILPSPHRTRPERRGGPASHYRRVERRVGRHVERVDPVTPNYALRRTVAACAFVVALVAGAVLLDGLLASFGGTPAAAEALPAASSGAATSHVARPGDTIWSIAAEHRGSVDRDRYIDALIRLNGDSASILVGQAVLLP